MARRVVALSLWGFAMWVLLTWTLTASQLLFGMGISVSVALACAPLGSVAAPWALLSPRRVGAIVSLSGSALLRIARANVSLARRVWTPARPLRSGLVIVPTDLTTEGGLVAVALITSVIVDNQIVDLDVKRRELLYHGVWIPSVAPRANYERMNGPIERYLKRIVQG